MFKCGDILINNPKPGKCQNWVRGLKSRKITYSRFTIPKTGRVPKPMVLYMTKTESFTIPKTGRVPKLIAGVNSHDFCFTIPKTGRVPKLS